MHAATRRTRAQTTRSGDLIDLSAIGWKEAALVALVILAGYMGYALVRLSMLNARRTAEAAPPPAPGAKR